jgi:hypothetical protein
MPSTATSILDGLSASVAVKAPCRTVSTSNITLAGLQTFNGVTQVDGDRHLATGQTDASENGIYITSTGNWTRAKDFDGNRDVVQGTEVIVVNGAAPRVRWMVTAASPIVIGTSDIDFDLLDDPAITYDQTAAEFDAGVTPTNDAYEPGRGERYSTLADAIAQLASGGAQVELERGATYTISSKISLSNLSNFRINGNGATIKAQDGMSVGSNTQLLHLTNCTDFVIENLKFDGNRANRTPSETSSHLLQLTDCQKFMLRNVRADNATTDGIRIEASSVADTATYGRDFVIDNCHADNAYRNGMGIINAWDGVVLGGSFTNTTGTAPEAGVDVESNGSAVDPGNRSIRFIGTRFTGNDGYGLQFASEDAATAMEAAHCYFADNDTGGLLAGAPTTVIGGEFENFTAAGALGIAVSATATAKLRVIGATFRTFGASADSCIDDGSTSGLVSVIGCEFKSVVNAVTASGARLIFTDNDVDTTSGVAVSVGSTKASIKGNRINSATGRAILSTGTYNEIVGNRCTDVSAVSGAYIQAEGAGNVITHNTCEAATSQATTIGIRAHYDATAVAFNRFVNLHTTNPISMQGSEVAGSAVVTFNSGGTANVPKQVKTAQLQLQTAILQNNAAAGATGEVVLGNLTQTTVGAAGGASALPATPSGYLRFFIGATEFVLPYYARA